MTFKMFKRCIRQNTHSATYFLLFYALEKYSIPSCFIGDDFLLAVHLMVISV